ncbi:MAG: hypothetical protein HC880_03105 [Bacteroidia bacterium]|nr:hypothetical protein [Bacteroidia bacterium]
MKMKNFLLINAGSLAIVCASAWSIHDFSGSLWVFLSLVGLFLPSYFRDWRLLRYITLGTIILFVEFFLRLLVPGWWIHLPLHPGRLVLSIGDWMTYSGVVLIGTPYALRHRWYWWLLLAFALLLLGGSRAGLLAFLVAVAFYFPLRLVLSVGFVGLGLIAFNREILFDDMSRFKFWHAALENVSWWGHGFGSFEFCSQDRLYCAHHPHNQFLTVLYEQGVFGFGSWSFWFLRHVRVILRHKDLLVLVVSHAIYGMFSSFLYLHLFLLCVALSSLYHWSFLCHKN